jgi:hypothetical protein
MRLKNSSTEGWHSEENDRKVPEKRGVHCQFSNHPQIHHFMAYEKK